MAEADLPEELIMRIFERLPIKPLIRFTCLSKRWQFIILSDPYFAKSQFQIASQNHTLNRRILFLNNTHEPESIPLPFEFESHGDLGDNNSCSYLRKLQFPPDLYIPPDQYIKGMCSSSNGLVCVCFMTSICIWNPSTRFYRRLPQLPHENDCSYRIITYGFGYVSSSDDYKVFVNIQNSQFVSQLEYYTWSLRGNIWKKVARPNFRLRWTSTLSNESLHWLIDARIVAFDLTKEEFRTMPLPISTDVRGHLTDLGASLGGSLCLLDIHNYCSADDLWFFADLLVLKEYGVSDSWTKQFSFKFPAKPWKLELVMETSILMQTGAGKLKLIRCDHEEGEEHEIRTVCENKHLLIDYQETLLRIS